MRIFINDRDVGTMPTSGATLGEIFEAARVYVDPGEIVTMVEVDGVAHHAGEVDQHLKRAADGVGNLVLRTQTPIVFAAAKRRGLVEAAVVLVAKVRRAAALLRQGEERAANSLLAALMEELRLAVLLDHQLTLLDGSAGGEIQAAIRAVAPELLQAQESRAWATVAEILENRLVGVLEAWGSRLETAVPASAL